MTEPRLISPMLDNFAMGGAISDHDGVRCYPAMENDTEDKYIVKVVSIPASPSQLEALLLTGAYPSKEAALVYFKETAEGVVQEADILETLSRMEGFLPCRAYQTVPMEDGSGYEVYLLSPYQRTLTKQFIRHPLTHLQAVNLGLDLCAALAVCRRAGYLYVALKPNNVYVTPDGSYKIGDLGFIPLRSLKYASLPDKYRSAYTALEITDAFSALNDTLDVYAAGLILYQAYNNGELPPMEEGQEPFPAPAYADYEMSEIILKACAPDPKDRWQDPMEMGQALVAYMQRNSVNDTPIVPLPEPAEIPPEPEEEGPSEEVISEEAEAAPVEETDAPEKPAAEETEAEASEPEDPETETEPIAEDEPQSPEETESEGASQEEAQTDEEAEDTQEPPEEPDELTDLSFMSEDETDAEDISYQEVSDEVNEMLSQADELVNHPVPDPVVPPEPIDVPIPEPIPPEPEEVPEEETETPSEEEAPEEEAEGRQEEAGEEPEPESEEPEEEEEAPPKKKTHWVRTTVIVLIIAAILAGGFFFYKNYYLLSIDSITLEGDRDSLTVLVDTDIDESLLQVVCADSYGTKISKPLVDGKAQFQDLVPDTGYNISVTVSGFHHLTGSTATAYSTPVQTEIVQFSAVTGAEDGTVILGFTIEGPDSKQWNVRYQAPGEEEKSLSFPSHTITIGGLTVGKTYTFTVAPEDDLYVTGTQKVTHTAATLVYPKDLTIVSCENGQLVAQWAEPEDAAVSSWTVRCYDGADYNKSMIVSDTTAVFEGLDETKAYTVEVTAAGMSVAERTYVTENSITVRDFKADLSDPNKIRLTWNTSHPIPGEGWILSYSIDGSADQKTIVTTENAAVIENAVPGATYSFHLGTAQDNMVLGAADTLQLPEPAEFSCSYDGYDVSASDMEFYMCRTPSDPNWNRYHLAQSDYTTTFVQGESASFLVKLSKAYGTSDDPITVLFVIRDENGEFVSAESTTDTWSNLWYRNYCELDFPSTPSQVGYYNVSVYFNGALANTVDFDITE